MSEPSVYGCVGYKHHRLEPMVGFVHVYECTWCNAVAWVSEIERPKGGSG